MLTEHEITILVTRIAERARPERIVVFGSYAKGTATVGSDLDLLVVKDTHLPMSQRADDLRPIVAMSLIPVDVHVYTPEEVEEYGKEEFSFLRTLLRTGRTLYEKGAEPPST